MTTSICAACCPDNQHQQQFLTPAQAELLTACLTYRAEEAIASEMAQDYQARQNHATEVAPASAITTPVSFNPRHPHRGRYYRLVQRNNNRAFHAGVKGRLSQKSVALILTLYRHHCLKCGAAQDITLDHITPMCKGGRGDITNIQPLCYQCNNTKAEQIADYRPRPTLIAVYAIYTLYRLDRLTHALRQHYRRATYRFDQRHATSPTRSGYHFDTDAPRPITPATVTTNPAISQ